MNKIGKMKIRTGVWNPTKELIKITMYKPSDDFLITKVKNGVYRVYLSHKDANTSSAMLSLKFDVKRIQTESGVCLEIKAKKPTRITITWDNGNEKSIRSAERKKAKFENKGYQFIQESISMASNICTIIYKVE